MVKDIPHLVKPEDLEVLEAPISEEEIKKAVWSLHPDKASRPDSFPIRFYRMCWHFIKKYLVHHIS